jgi:hypothetical protein
MQREANQLESERSFNRAFTEFQAEAPPIPKTKSVNTRTGALLYKYAPADVIEDKIRPLLRKYGLAARYTDVPPERDPKNVRTRCYLVHKDGHSVFSDFEAPPDDKNTTVGAMHKSGGAGTFTARYALLRVLGLITTDDNDGHLPPESQEKITPEQVAIISRLIVETESDEQAFLNFMGIARVD